MNDHLLKMMEFRAFSFETDPEYVVDMHRAQEILEGSWFDREDTLKMYNKMVLRAKGSSWLLTVAKAVVGYADAITCNEGGFITRWRLHPDFRHPKVAKILFNGLKTIGRKRDWNSMTLYADNAEVAQDIESAGIPRDRCFQWISLGEVEPLTGALVDYCPMSLTQALDQNFLPFLGCPLPPSFLITRSFLAYEYGAFSFRKPDFYRIPVGDILYTALYDGREWFIFRKEKNNADSESIKRLLSAIASFSPGRILLSEKAIEKADMVPASDETFWDFFIPEV